MKDDDYTSVHPCFWSFNAIRDLYTPLSFSAHPLCPLPTASSGKAEKSKVSACWLLLSTAVQMCCSQQLAERAMGVHSILIVSWVYICFIFRLSLNPGRQKEAQSFPRERIFLQGDRGEAFEQPSLSLPPASPSEDLEPSHHLPYLFSPLFTAAVSFSFLVFPPKCISSFSFLHFPANVQVCNFFYLKNQFEYATFICCVQSTLPPRENVFFSEGQLDFYKIP